MATSAAFIRIKADILKIVAAIPARKLCSFRSIGEHLDVMPRHVAYILAQLSDEEKTLYPWYRVVSDGGKLGAPKFGVGGISQVELLRDEGIIVSNSCVTAFEEYFIPAAKLKSDVKKQLRPVDRSHTKRTKPVL